MPFHSLDGSTETTLPSLLTELKQELLSQKALIMQLQEQINNLNQTSASSPQEQSNVRELGNLDNYRDGDNRINFTKYNSDLRETSYQIRQTTRSLHGLVLLMKETGMLKKDQEETYRNIHRTITVMYQAQRAFEAFETMTRLSMATNPVGWALAGVNLAGRAAFMLGSANRQTGSGV